MVEKKENVAAPAVSETELGEVALRGRTALTASDLRAHFAALLELPHVGALLGSGSSREPGGKTLQELAKVFNGQTAKGMPLEGARSALVNLGIDFSNLEKAWSTLLLLLEASNRATNLMTEDQQKAATGVLKQLMSLVLQATPPISGLAGTKKTTTGIIPLDRLLTHRELLRKLVHSRQPGQPAAWFFTTNYDLLLEFASELEGLALINGFEGLHTREFSPSSFDLGRYSTDARGEARFGNTYAYLAKLHGSVTWWLRGRRIVERSWLSVCKAFREFLANPMTTEMPDCVLIPPAASKYLDTVGFIQGELFRRLAEFVNRPNTVLFVNGYSFSDEHVNRLVVGGLQNPTFHLVVGCFDQVVRDGELWNKGGVLNESLEKLQALSHPGITFVCGEAAKFQTFVQALPDAAALDAQTRALRRGVDALVRQIEGEGKAAKPTKESSDAQ